jgi:hypothetical protein
LAPTLETLEEALSEAHIPYSRKPFRAGEIVAGSSWIDVAITGANAVPAAALAMVAVAWFRARASRKMMLTMPDRTVIQAEGVSVEDFSKLLPLAQSMMATDTAKRGDTEAT